MITRWGTLVSLFITPMLSAHSLSQQQPLQYDYIKAELSSGRVSDLYSAGESDNVTALLLGVSHKWQDSNGLMVGDYSARFYHPDNQTIERYQLRLGAGYRWLWTDNLDFVAHIKAGGLRIRMENDDSTTDFIYSADIGLRYAWTAKFEVSLTGEAIRNPWQDENIATLRADYYLFKRVALGGLVSYRDGEENDVSEMGLTLRVNY